MIKADIPANEIARVAALRQYQILDTAPEQTYDDVVRLAATICDAPMAYISLVDSNRQWFKAKVGVDARETPRDIAFCAHAILEDDVMVVENALLDRRFFDNPLVTGEPGIRFYAGSPLKDPQHLALGTVCVADRKPRTLAREQLEALRALTRQVQALIELRRVCANLASSLAEIKTIQGLLPICSHCREIKDDEGAWNKLEEYVSRNTNVLFSHGICPDCLEKYYPETGTG